jgi:hypothetical protein
LGGIFQKKSAPNAKKFRPRGKISPNLVTLLASRFLFIVLQHVLWGAFSFTLAP